MRRLPGEAIARWAQAIATRDRRAIAQATSALENETGDAAGIRAALAGRVGHARVIGGWETHGIERVVNEHPMRIPVPVHATVVHMLTESARIHILDALPKTSVAKTDKKTLRQWAAEGPS